MDTHRIRNRLESLKIIEAVMPTAPLNGSRIQRLRGIAGQLEAGNLIDAEAEAADDIRRILPGEYFSGSAVGELAISEAATEQLACFSRAGYNFFRSTTSFLRRSLNDRRSVGGNGTIKRVLRSGEQLLLETARLIVRFQPGVSESRKEDVMRRHRLIRLRTLTFANAEHCVTEHGNLVDLCLQLIDEPEIDYAEPDFIEAIPQRLIPTDPEFANQWHHQTLRNADAWDIVTGSPIRIAVIDNGFDRHHSDLKFDPDLSGWYRQTPDGDDAMFIAGVQDMPDSNHGTACAGMAAAVSNNGGGGTGVAFDASLHGIACLPDQVGTQLTLARALAYAADPSIEQPAAAGPGADVISCSLGPNGATWEIQGILSDAIDFVANTGRNGLGAPIFWAATNGNFPISADEVCSHPHTIVVGRSSDTDQDDGSGFGPELDFLAPGVNVWIPASGGGYHSTTGTSFAAPCAAGVAALALARNATLSGAEVRALLRGSAEKIGNLPYDQSGRNDFFGFGRIDALKAVRAV